MIQVNEEEHPIEPEKRERPWAQNIKPKQDKVSNGSEQESENEEVHRIEPEKRDRPWAKNASLTMPKEVINGWEDDERERRKQKKTYDKPWMKSETIINHVESKTKK